MQTDYINEYKKVLMLCNSSENTINCYCSIVSKFLSYFKISPIKINESQIIDYILNYNNTNTKAQQIGALKLFYRLVVKQPLKFKYIEYPRKESKLPIVLSQEEMKRLIGVITNKKHKAIVCLIYFCGLRVSEVINLKISGIDKERHIIRIIGAKGFKDRNVPLSDKLRNIFIEYYKQYKPVEYLFNGQLGLLQYSESSIRQFLNKYRKLAKIEKIVCPHIIRHTCFTHLFEAGIDLGVIQDLAGHKSPKTTAIYRHLSNRFISKISLSLESVLD